MFTMVSIYIVFGCFPVIRRLARIVDLSSLNYTNIQPNMFFGAFHLS